MDDLERFINIRKRANERIAAHISRRYAAEGQMRPRYPMGETSVCYTLPASRYGGGMEYSLKHIEPIRKGGEYTN